MAASSEQQAAEPEYRLDLQDVGRGIGGGAQDTGPRTSEGLDGT